MNVQKDLAQMAHLAEEAAEFAVAGQKAAMGMLLAEMQALSAILPGQSRGAADEDARAAEERQRAEEARVEEAFDNMPV